MTKRAKSESNTVLNFAEGDIQFSDIFDLVEVQKLQNLFSDANGVASLITKPDGTPITVTSNFCKLCTLVRDTKKGAEKCALSDMSLCSPMSNTPVVKKCLSAGLWDASAPISIGGRHIANWLIGQVRNNELDDQQIINYADEIGANRADFILALKEVPVMSTVKFKQIAEMLFAFANQLSEKAYKNLQLKLEIADRTLAEQALIESEDNYKAIFNSVNEAIFILDAETGYIIDVNDAALIVYGYSTKESILACNIGDLSSNIANYTEDITKEYLRKAFTDGSQTFEWLARRKDGTHFWTEMNLKRVIIGGKNRIMAAGRDISLWKKTEKSLLESEERSRLLLDTVNEGILVGQDGYLKYFNPFVISFTGYSEAELRSMPFLDLVDVDDREFLLRNYQKRINGDDFEQRYQLRITTKGGILKWIELSGVKFEWEGSAATLNFVTDVTERKLAEKSLSESEEKYAKAFQSAPYGMVILNPQSDRIIEVNDFFCAIIDYSNDEIISDISIGLKIWAKSEDKQSVIDNSLNGVSVIDRDIQLIKRTGQVITTSISTQVISIHEINCVLLTVNDITQRKLDEYEIRTKSEELNYLNGRFSSALEKIKISNNELSNINDELEAKRAALTSEKIFSEAILEGIPGFFYVYDDEQKIVKWNRNHETMTGYSAYEISNMTLDDWYDNDELIKVRMALKVVSDVGSGEMESQLKRKDGSKIFVRIKAVKVIQDNKTYILGVGIDITAWKNAEQKLTESESRYRSIVTASPDDITITDLEGRILMVSPSALSLFSSKSENELIGQYLADFIAPEDCERATDDIGLLLQGVSTKVREYRCVRHDGTFFYIEVNGEFIRNTEGTPIQMLFVVRDVTVRKEAEDNLNRQNTLLDTLIQNLTIGVFMVEAPTGKPLLANNAALELLGRGILPDATRDNIAVVYEAYKVDSHELYPPDEMPILRGMMGEVSHTSDMVVLRPDGTKKLLEIFGAPVKDEKGNVWASLVSFFDITERKQTEDAILNAMAFQQSLLDAIPSPVFYKDLNGRYIGANRAFESFVGLSQSEFIGKTVYDISPRELADKFNNWDIDLLAKLGVQIYESPTVYADGTRRDVIFNKATFKNSEGKLAGLIGVMQDISERKSMEKAILHSSRLYALLSHINQAIVHSKNQDELFKTICDVAVEIGHFRMAWIGLIDAENSIRPTTFAGHEDGYLTNIVINTLDPNLTQGPVGRAFQTGSVVAIHNIAKDERMSPWCESALARNYHSVAAVPFLSKEKIVGFLTLYSSEIGFFNNDEQQLLQEIGDDISFALDSMANEVERNRAQAELNLNNSRLELAMYSANMAWWEMDMTTGLVVFDKRKAEILGYLPDKFHHYKDFMALVHPDDAEPIMENMRQHLCGNFDKYEVEYRILASTGEYLWFYDVGSITTRDLEGKPYLVAGLVIDISDRKRGEIALFQNEEMLRESQMIAGLSGYVLDFITNMWKGSETLDQIMGISSTADHTVQAWLDIMHADDRQRMTDYFLHVVVELRGRFDKSYRIVRQNDKEVRWVHCLGELSYDASGNMLKMRGTLQDITEQKLAEGAILEREQRYRAIFENNQAVMLIMDPESANIVDANESACIYYGYSYEQITSMKISDINLMSLDQLRSKLNQSATKEQSHFYFQHRLASGIIRDVEVYSGPINISGERFVYTIVHDITERREAETKIIETSSLLKSILESSPEIIVFALDKEYRYLTFNARHKEVMKHLWGAEIEVGMSMFDIISDESDSEIVKVNFDRALAGESFVQSEEYNKENLVQISWLNYWSPIRDGAGKISGITCFVLNVTEQKQAEAIKAQNVELSVANADKDRFISILAHDLRSPFNAILGYLQLLMSHIRDYDIDQIENHLNTINTSAKHAYKLLEDILMWARAQSGKLPFEPEKWNFGNICNEVICELKFNAANKNITINDFKSPQDFFVMADINMLKTILRNLISNAIKFSYYGGTIEVKASQNETQIIISVVDSGVGMSNVAISRLFDFTHNHTTLGTAKEKGTGLGLLLCKEFVDKHGGAIWVESVVSQGTTFFFTLPVFKDPIFEIYEDGLFDNEVLDDVQGNYSIDLNILVVDNDLDSRDIVQKHFERYSKSISFAKDGAEAISLCTHNRNIDLVLVDMHLSDISGYEVAKQIRQINPKLIIIAQTAFAVAGVKEKALGAGCNDYLPKPFKRTALADLMKKYFPST